MYSTYGTLKIILNLQTSMTTVKRVLLLRRYNVTLEEARQIAREFSEWNQFPLAGLRASWSADTIEL